MSGWITPITVPGYLEIIKTLITGTHNEFWNLMQLVYELRITNVSNYLMITLAGEEGSMDKRLFSSDSLFHRYSCFLVCFPLQAWSICYWAFMIRDWKTLLLNKDKTPRQTVVQRGQPPHPLNITKLLVESTFISLSIFFNTVLLSQLILWHGPHKQKQTRH